MSMSTVLPMSRAAREGIVLNENGQGALVAELDARPFGAAEGGGGPAGGGAGTGGAAQGSSLHPTGGGTGVRPGRANTFGTALAPAGAAGGRVSMLGPSGSLHHAGSNGKLI